LLTPLVERHPAELDAWLALAEASIELGRLSEARQAISHLTDRLTLPRVRLLSARIDLANGLQTEPEAALRALLSDLPGHHRSERAHVRRFLADALERQGRADDARVELETLLLDNPRHAEGTLALAELHLKGNRPKVAIELLSALTDHHGKLAHAHRLLGRAHLQDGTIDAAERAFRRLWELAPHQPDARYWLSNTLSQRGQLDQARRLLEGNLKRFPAHAESLEALSRLIERAEGKAAAHKFVTEHGKTHGDSAAVAGFEAQWLLSHSDTEGALRAYRRALSNDPSHFAAARGLALFYARRGKGSSAQSVIDGAIAHRPNAPQLYLLAARLDSDQGRYNQAKAYCEQAVQLSPGNPSALAQLAELHAEAFKNFAGARKLASQAYASAPGNSEVLAAFGWVTHLSGAPDQALPYLEKANALSPDNPRLIYRLGATLLAVGNSRLAKNKLARVVELDPLFPTAKEIRTLLAKP
jgi:tetratricopeptide (TPR) repeat protein